MGDLRKAEQACRRAVEGFEKTLGSESVWTIMVAKDMETLQTDSGKPRVSTQAQGRTRSPVPTIATSSIPPSQTYSYKSLPTFRHIRLLRCSRESANSTRIVRSLESVLIDECHPFWALSYTWGSAMFPEEENEALYTTAQTEAYLEIDGNHLRITPNLRDAIVALDSWASEIYASPAGHAYFWINAICINQEDYDERCSQVLFMGDVYSSATATLLSLGLDTSNLEGFCRAHRLILPFFHSESSPSRDILLSKRPSDPMIFSLLEVDFFERWWYWAAYYSFFHQRR